MILLQDLNEKEITDLVVKHGYPKFRGSQLFNAMLSGKDYNEDINLPKEMLQDFSEKEYILQCVKISKKVVAKDKTTKFLFKLYDGNIIEGVLMEYKFGKTLCISTQVGCRMNCAFCASGLGFTRNLSAGEILGQIVSVNKLLGGTVKERAISNIVLMGSGEPLDNYDNLVKFLRLATDPKGFNIGVRSLTVSTCGVPRKMEKLADEGLNIHLAISLHASNNEVRKAIMPVSKSYSLESVIDAAKYFNTVTSRRIMIEYALIKGVNDSQKDALALANLLKNLECHVNLIRLNPVKERGLLPSSEEAVQMFLETLIRSKISTTVRRKMGDDVQGACGQLRAKVEKTNSAASNKREE